MQTVINPNMGNGVLKAIQARTLTEASVEPCKSMCSHLCGAVSAAV